MSNTYSTLSALLSEKIFFTPSRINIVFILCFPSMFLFMFSSFPCSVAIATEHSIKHWNK